MDIQFINITTYRGISSNAEHYYARLATDATKVQESFMEGFEIYSFSEDLLFFPEREQAVELCRKENSMRGIDSVVSEEQIEKMMDEGTIRFLSVFDVVETARKKFPGSVLVFLMNGTKKEFIKYLQSLIDHKKDELLKKIINTVSNIQRQ